MSQSQTYQLLIKNTQEPCILVDLKVDIAIAGFLCQTSVTMVFRNPTDNETEGELVFPMSDGAVMCGYAVDISGVLVDGVVVEVYLLDSLGRQGSLLIDAFFCIERKSPRDI
jgi:hypothetical protein